MHFEIYWDRMFIMSFSVHLYLLLLLRKILGMRGRNGRIIAGALIGGLGVFLPFFMGGNPWLRYILSAMGSTAGMLWIAFGVREMKVFGLLGEKLLLVSLLFCGGYLWLMQMLPLLRGLLSSVAGVLGAGGVLYLLLEKICGRLREKNCFCKIILKQGAKQITVQGMVDTGNSLREPISGKPVSVAEEDVLKELFQNEFPPGRVIPYRAVGTKQGFLMGYLLQEVRVRSEVSELICRDVYVAATAEPIQGNKKNSIKMLVNPRMLQ